MNSSDLARYLEATDSVTKPWLLAQLRLQKLRDRQASLPPEQYAAELADIHHDLMQLGEWWVGLEEDVFG